MTLGPEIAHRLMIVSQIGIDPTPWTAWGVLGLLGLAFVVFLGILWKLFTASTSAMAAQGQTIMDFVNLHRTETTKALNEISDKHSQALAGVTDKVVISQDRMTSAFAKVARAIDELVLLERIYDRVSKRPSTDTKPLTDDEIERIVRVVKNYNKD